MAVFERLPLGFRGLIATDVQGAMRGANSFVSVRIPLALSELTPFDSLELKVKYNDGLIIHLHGQEVARRSAPVQSAWKSAATGAREDGDAVVLETIDLTGSRDLLEAGTNVIAIHGLNIAPDDPGFLILYNL